MAVIGDNDIGDTTGLSIIVGAGSIASIVLAIACVFWCCKRDEDKEKASSDKEASENASTAPQVTGKVALPGLTDPSSDSDKKTDDDDNENPVISTNNTGDTEELQAESRETTNCPTEDRMSVIYAKPEKKQRNANTDNNTKLMSPNGDVESSVNISMKTDDHLADDTPEHLYAKPIKANVNNGGSCKDPQMDIRLSLSDDYATIRDTSASLASASSTNMSPAYAVSQRPASPNAKSPVHASNELNAPKKPTPDLTSAYEEVNLDAMSSPVDGVPASPPPRSVLGTPTPKPPDDAFSPAHGKSTSLRQPTTPYAHTQLVPRSKSAHDRAKFNRSRDDETMVELGSPGIKNPSIKIPGSPTAVIDILDYNDNTDYERVEIVTASEIPKSVMIQMSNVLDDDDLNYERVEIPKDLGRSAQRSLMQAPGQKAREGVDGESGWADNIIYSSIDNVSNSDSEESSPQLVTYEQTTNLLKVNQHTDQIPVEDDYEEIRRSRLANSEDEDLSRDSTTYEIVDGKIVPFSEL